MSPKVIHDSYTTVDSATTSDTVFIIDFSVECSNGMKAINVYADLNGKIVPASRISNSDKYQVGYAGQNFFKFSLHRVLSF